MKKSIFLIIYVILSGCNNEKPLTPNPELAIQLNEKLTEAIIRDGFSPPVASRIYAYCNIAAYESVYFKNKDFKSLSGQLNDLHLTPINEESENEINEEIVLLKAFSDMAVTLVYRDYVIEQFRDSLLEVYQKNVSSSSFDASIEYAENLSSQLIQWKNKDLYRETRNMPRFSPGKTLKCWQPTSPTFGDAAEPHFSKIRTFITDSSGMYPVKEYEEFSTDTNSTFFREQVLNTYERTLLANEDTIEYALFWDCNPQRTITKGHLMYTARQMTPPGHWVAITSIACRKQNGSLEESAEAFVLVSLGLFEAMSNSWHEKYRTNFIRPETYIHKFYQPGWHSIIETPLFPEHPSAHSAISAASATILTQLFGENFSYVDSSEMEFGLPARSFNSFREAANEAADSRVVAGIHFPLARDEGIRTGDLIGSLVLNKVRTREASLISGK